MSMFEYPLIIPCPSIPDIWTPTKLFQSNCLFRFQNESWYNVKVHSTVIRKRGYML